MIKPRKCLCTKIKLIIICLQETVCTHRSFKTVRPLPLYTDLHMDSFLANKQTENYVLQKQKKKEKKHTVINMHRAGTDDQSATSMPGVGVACASWICDNRARWARRRTRGLYCAGASKPNALTLTNRPDNCRSRSERRSSCDSDKAARLVSVLSRCWWLFVVEAGTSPGRSVGRSVGGLLGEQCLAKPRWRWRFSPAVTQLRRSPSPLF